MISNNINLKMTFECKYFLILLLISSKHLIILVYSFYKIRLHYLTLRESSFFMNVN